jgi:hypothetical protein
LVFNPKSSSKHEEQLLIQRRRTASITWESLDESRSVPSAAQNTPNGANSPASKPASVFAGKWKEIAIVGSAVGRVSDKIMKEGSNRRFSVNGDETQWDLVGGNQPAKIIAKQGRTFTAIDHDHTDPKRWQSRMEFTVSSDGKTAHSRTVTKWKDHSTELDQIDWRKTE